MPSRLCANVLLALLSSLLRPEQAEGFTAIPTFSARELDWQRFDNEFLNKGPVIIEGVTNCPASFSLSRILEACLGSADVEVHNISRHLAQELGMSPSTANSNTDTWAGLAPPQKTSLAEYVGLLRENALPEATYAFGLRIAEHCPWALEEMMMPSHLINVFALQLVARSRMTLPDPRAYLNNMYFSTSLHIDAAHASFYSSMCEGRKLWRVVTNEDFRNHRDEFNPYLLRPGIEANSKLVLASVIGSFDTWSDASPLETINVTVYEGIQEPGSVLYLPGGCLHAARALTNPSVMVATNTHTFNDVETLRAVCSMEAARRHTACSNRFVEGSDWTIVQQNRQRFGPSVAREDRLLLEVYKWSSKQKLCGVMGPASEAWGSYCNNEL